MRIPRIYTPQPLAVQDSVTLERAASQHLLTVLRLKPGAALVLFDGSGCEFEARLDADDNRRARILVTAECSRHSESPLRISLAQGISRGERMDYTLQKAVELGITEIVPVVTERSVVRLNAEHAQRKREHWQRLVISACEQSGRVRIPPVHVPLSYTDFLRQPTDAAHKLLLDPEGSLTLNMLERPANALIHLLVGPEGGLSKAEKARALATGYAGVRLGPRILRTETAALVALSLLQGSWGDLVGD